MNISEIKRDYQEHNQDGHYFDAETLRFFGQTLKDFTVEKIDEGIYSFSAPSRWRDFQTGRLKIMGYFKGIYDFNTHTLSQLADNS